MAGRKEEKWLGRHLSMAMATNSQGKQGSAQLCGEQMWCCARKRSTELRAAAAAGAERKDARARTAHAQLSSPRETRWAVRMSAPRLRCDPTLRPLLKLQVTWGALSLKKFANKLLKNANILGVVHIQLLLFGIITILAINRKHWTHQLICALWALMPGFICGMHPVLREFNWRPYSMNDNPPIIFEVLSFHKAHVQAHMKIINNIMALN